MSSPVVDNDDTHRFELEIGDSVAHLDYRRNGNRLVLVHTEVPNELEGQGVGGQLVRFAIATAQRDGSTIVPLCPFARGWLERHPDVTEDVTIDWSSPEVG